MQYKSGAFSASLAKIGGLALLLVVARTAAVVAQEPATPGAPGPALQERLEKIEDVLSNQGLLQMLQQLESLEREINRLRGQVEVQAHTLEQLQKRQRDMYADLDTRLQRIETRGTSAADGSSGAGGPPLPTLAPLGDTGATRGEPGTEAPLTLELVDQQSIPDVRSDAGAPEDIVPPAATTDAGAPEDIVPPAATTDAGALSPAERDPQLVRAEYQQAFDLLKEARYEQAVLALQGFLARHPDGEDAANARFWLAEAYYVNSLFEQALAEYTALAQQYPDSPKLAQARLKAAFCRHELGQAEAARQQLEDLILQYPGTTVASLARDRLVAMAAETAPANTAPTN